MKHIKEFKLNESTVSFNERLDKLQLCHSNEEQLRLIYMWIKQEHINLKQFIEMINKINN